MKKESMVDSSKAGNLFSKSDCFQVDLENSHSFSVNPLESGLNRRAFMRQAAGSVLITSILACKPVIDQEHSSDEQKNRHSPSTNKFGFTPEQKESLIAVHMQLFPDDGDGPSAKDINSLDYLEWALTDPDNQSDGDGEFVIKGVGWLNDLSTQTQGDQFSKLSVVQKEKVLKQISQSSTGESWMSLLLYYLMEALLLDPFYGGNPDGIGWKWLKHQPGFPAPDQSTNYRNFQ